MSARDDFVARLRAHPLFQHALGRAKDDAERRQIAAIAESFVGPFADILGPLIDQARRDPAFAASAGQDLASAGRVLTSGTLG